MGIRIYSQKHRSIVQQKEEIILHNVNLLFFRFFAAQYTLFLHRHATSVEIIFSVSCLDKVTATQAMQPQDIVPTSGRRQQLSVSATTNLHQSMGPLSYEHDWHAGSSSTTIQTTRNANSKQTSNDNDNEKTRQGTV